MDSALKGLMLAAGIILTCMVIGVGFYVAREAQATAVASTNQLSEFEKNLSESSLTKYEGVEVTGSDVINFAKKTLGSYDNASESPVYVQIKTSLHTEKYKTNSYLADMRDFTHQRYVSPISVFLGSVVRDENDVIVGVVFIQK